MTDTDRITDLERLVESLTAQIAALKAEKAAYKVGDWVEAIEDGELSGRYYKAGAKGQIQRPSTSTGVWVKFTIGEYKGDGVWTAPLNNLKLIDTPAPAKPDPLKYKIGDYVLVPMKVTDIDDDEEPYGLTTINGKFHFWIDRATLEPARPKVGQRVVAFKLSSESEAVVGKLSDDDHNDMPFMLETSHWYYTAYTLPD